jgi:hypothetical protein
VTTKLPDGPALCPSAPGTPGAVLVGVVEADGRVANLGTPLPVDAGFLDAARAHGPPERRFRFSSPCTEGRCAQWDGRGCGLIDRIHDHVEAAGALEIPQTLRACAIRAGCRWWRQRGAAACAVCPLVATDPGLRAADAAPAR